ncbi:MAG: hypothetical protein K2P10_07145, partial [Oscillospiraceae bacterium]|nr:hypothetical protein [Oscillospiraceae bacterium]
MKKRILVPLAALLCLTMLGGCKYLSRTNIDFDADSISKAQQIVVQDAAGNEKAVLEEEEEIDAFESAMNVEGWRFAEVPEGLKEAGSFTLWQQETVTAFIGSTETEMKEICTLRIYEDGDYLTIETGLIDVPFAIPQSTAE